MRQRRKLDRAESICSALIRRHPGYVAALHTLGLVYLDKGNFERALDCLVRAAMLSPQAWVTLTALGHTYLRLGAIEMATRTLEQARMLNPHEAAILVSLAEAYEEEREYERAQEAYRSALTLEPRLEAAAIGLAVASSSLGQQSEAAGAIRHALKQGHRSLNLFRTITTLPPLSIDVDVLAELDRMVIHPSDREGKNTIAFVRSAALDAAGRHAEAWECLVPANRMLFEQKREALKNEVARQEESSDWLLGTSIRTAKPISSDGSPVSLFILGPSRSGKTTLEQLVGLFDGVKRGFEGPIVENALRGAFQSAALPNSIIFEQLPANSYPIFGEFYLKELRRRAPSARVVTNTIAARIHDIARIATTVPNVRLVFMKRDIEDNTLRIFMRKYIRGNAYAYQIKSIYEHLLWYHQMSDRLAEIFSDISLVINSETMVSNPAVAVREIKILCGLAGQPEHLPEVGDDSGCATPYRDFMSAAMTTGI